MARPPKRRRGQRRMDPSPEEDDDDDDAGLGRGTKAAHRISVRPASNVSSSDGKVRAETFAGRLLRIPTSWNLDGTCKAAVIIY